LTGDGAGATLGPTSDESLSWIGVGFGEKTSLRLVKSGLALTWSAIGLGCWIGYQLILQNGRLLLRVEALEKRVEQLGVPREAEVPATRVRPSKMAATQPVPAGAQHPRPILHAGDIADRADHASGVNLIGDLSLEGGLGEAARATVNAILRRGIPVSYVEVGHVAYEWDRSRARFPGQEPPGMSSQVRREPDVDQPSRDQARAPDYLSLPRGNRNPINVLCCQPAIVRQVSDRRLDTLTGGKYTVASWVWELPRLPRQWLAQVSRVDEIWVPSRFVRESMLTAADTPVLIVPYAVDVHSSPPCDRAVFGIPENRYVFLFSFDARSHIGRKNPWAVIDAFQHAFGCPARDGPLLVLRARYLDLFPLGRRALERAVARVGGILLEEPYSRRQIDGLMRCADAYISLHRAEGFGLGIAEAMYLGKPVIATNYSGNIDYMTTENSYPVRYHLRPIAEEEHRYQPDPSSRAWYEPGQLWAEPDVTDAALWMEHLYHHQDEGRSRGQRAAAEIRRFCSPEVIGRLIDARLQEIEAMGCERVARSTR
jgi:glycosyltransferase involved in cell wall biosynthesis